MKKIIFAVCLCLTFNLLFAQTDSTKTKDTTVKFETVQVEAAFPGGTAGWRNYLEQNLKADLLEKCVKLKKGQKMVKQTVIVSFKVDTDGSISQAVAENASAVCPSIAAEAVRVILNGPKWIPAIQNGRNVIYRQRQSITWVYSEE